MSLSRCVTTPLRSRHAIRKLLLPATSTVVHGFSKGDEVAIGREICLPTIQSEVRLARHYSSKRAVTARKHYRQEDSDSSDSDREKGRGKQGKHSKRGQSSFWRQKMRTHHNMIDINKDGVVSWDDFEALIKKFSVFGHLSSKEMSKFTNALRQVWEEEWGGSGDPYVFVGPERFLSQMEHVINTKELRKRVASPLPYFFKAVDRDGSGEISLEEFKMFYSCLGLSEQAAEDSFAAIDLNSDGKLSKKEFVKLGRDFFLSEDESRPSKLFWGPLTS